MEGVRVSVKEIIYLTFWVCLLYQLVLLLLIQCPDLNPGPDSYSLYGLGKLLNFFEALLLLRNGYDDGTYLNRQL